MRRLFNYSAVMILGTFLSGCSMEASIADLYAEVTTGLKNARVTLGIAPSQQEYSHDEFQQYRTQSTVGEIAAGVGKANRGTKTYRSEISVSFQKL